MHLYTTINDKAKEREKDIVRLTMDLVRTRSFSTKEKDAAQVLRRQMEDAGLENVRIDGIGNVIGSIGNGPLKIAFDGLHQRPRLNFIQTRQIGAQHYLMAA